MRISDWSSDVCSSDLLMHGFVYAVEFRGQKDIPEGARPSGVFIRYTVAGYALALLISLYILWTFGRTDGIDFREMLTTVIVLGFPAALGAAAARLNLRGSRSKIGRASDRERGCM